MVGLVFAILPNQSGQPGPVGGFSAGTPQLADEARVDPATERARSAAEAKTRPRAVLFLTDIVSRKHLERSYGQLAPSLEERYDRRSWLNGDGLPFARQVGGYQSG